MQQRWNSDVQENNLNTPVHQAPVRSYNIQIQLID